MLESDLRSEVKHARDWLLLVLVNAITLSRFYLAYLFARQILIGRGIYVLLLLFFLAAVTDFIDGRLARTWGVESKLGSLLDVTADFCFVLSACIALYFCSLVPAWMIGVLLLKTAEFFITSSVLRIQRMKLSDEELERRRFHRCSSAGKLRKNVFVYDVVGRVVAAMFYILPMAVLILAEFSEGAVQNAALNVFFVPLAVASLVSSAHRVSLCYTWR